MNNPEVDKLKQRTKAFGVDIILTIKKTEYKDIPFQILSRQVIKSCTSVAANYRACQRAKSKADFISKITTVVEESDETEFWLDLLFETGYLSQELHLKFGGEALEILKIMSKTRSTALSNNA